MFQERVKFKVTLIPILALGLVAGTTFLGKQIWDRIDRDIYNHPRGDVTEKTPGSYGLDYNEVEFDTRNNLTLKGWYVPADGEGTNNFVILAPGKTENRWDMIQYAPFLVKSGFDVLLFDPRSTGLSEGNRYGFGYFESKDLISAADYAMSKENVEKVALFGRSAGATASLLAAKDASSIEAVVADSPYANLKLASKDFGSYSSDLTLQVFFPVYIFAAKLAPGINIYNKTNILKKNDKIQAPIFLIHGLKDTSVGYQNSERLFKRKTRPKKLWLVPETDHVQAFKNEKKTYCRKMVKFLKKWL